MTPSVVTDPLRELVRVFRAKGYDLRLVGGCVRDLLMGKEPKDIDLCTDARPEQMVDLANEFRIIFYPTGLAHGTVTFRMGEELYEVTSLRTESDHDGRYATMAFTTDWEADLARRDLTINAIMMTIEGDIIDPFNGRDDIAASKVRFVGDAGERMKEDYLRILRWLRFHGRISPDAPLDAEAARAAEVLAIGLKDISAERVWMEMAKIVTESGSALLTTSVVQKHIGPAIGLGAGSAANMNEVRKLTRNPVTLLAAYLHEDVLPLAERWKWSNEEKALAKFLLTADAILLGDYKYLLAVQKVQRDWVVELALFHQDAGFATVLRSWEVPERPITGNDLLDIGYKPGKALGATLTRLTNEWAASGYTEGRDALLAKAKLAA